MPRRMAIVSRGPASRRYKCGCAPPHTPNPASGFVHYVSSADIIRLDWPIEDGLKVIVSGGVVQPPNVPGPVKPEAFLSPS